MKSGLRIGSMIIGFIIIGSINFKSDFTAFGDYLAFLLGVGLPMLMVILPVVFEFIERTRK
jgi:hypothetical protein